MRVLDQFIDQKGDSVFLTSVRLRVKNVAIKHGRIEKAEFVPFTIQTRPRIEVLGVESRDLRWGEAQVVEVRSGRGSFLMAPREASIGPWSIGPWSHNAEDTIRVRPITKRAWRYLVKLEIGRWPVTFRPSRDFRARCT